MSQRSRTARGPGRNGQQQGEEYGLWQSIKEDLKHLIDLQNTDSEAVQIIITQDQHMHNNRDTMDAEAEEKHQEDNFRKGVKTADAVQEHIKRTLEQLNLIRAIQKSKDEEAESKQVSTPSRSSLLGAGSSRSVGRAGMREREKERERERERDREREKEREKERAREKEKEKEKERDKEREREKEHEQDKEKEKEREKEKDRDRERERVKEEKEKKKEKEREREKEKEKEGDIKRELERETEREKDPYEFDGPGDEMDIDTSTNLGNGHGTSRKGNGERGDLLSHARDSVPRGDVVTSSVKADSAEPQGPGSAMTSAAQRSRVMFVKGQDVVFKPKPANLTDTAEWFLGKVQQVLGEGKSRRYKVKDEDPDVAPEQRQEYRTSASNMIPLPPPGQDLLVLEAGKTVLALYPDSTTFYKAEVMSTDKSTGRVNLRFEGEENSGTLQEVERRFVVEFRN
ncbi:MAG: hypothetical protein SEPTF4163_003886 [Sporothrix epigloea]